MVGKWRQADIHGVGEVVEILYLMQKHAAVKELESSWHRILTPQSPTLVTYLLQQGHNYSKNAIPPYYSQIA